MRVYRFLIVDDTQFMRKMATDSLKQFDYEVVGEAANGKEAIAKYAELKPDIVLMDLTMPEMNGIEAIRSILRSDPAAVILVCSSSNQKEMIEEAIKAGAKGYLTKPFKPEFMEEVIRKYALPHVADKSPLSSSLVFPAHSGESAKAPDKPVEAPDKPVEAPDKPVAESGQLPGNPLVSPGKHGKVSNFVTSAMCSWQEEHGGASSSYAVTCTGQENKLVIEWTGTNQEKQCVELTIDGFRHLADWLNGQVPAVKQET